jgi:mitogen-activated protein kinase kinase
MAARPIRTKRNFKALQLDVSQPSASPQPEPELMPTRLAPAVGAKAGAAGAPKKKRPPPMQLKTPKPIETPSGEDGASFGDGMGPAPSATTASASHRMTYHTTLSNTLANLDLNAEIKYDLRDEDLRDLTELGQGNGGSVKKVEHVPTHTIMAKKVRIVCIFLTSMLIGWL